MFFSKRNKKFLKMVQAVLPYSEMIGTRSGLDFTFLWILVYLHLNICIFMLDPRLNTKFKIHLFPVCLRHVA
jgi:hypothetical protein